MTKKILQIVSSFLNFLWHMSHAIKIDLINRICEKKNCLMSHGSTEPKTYVLWSCRSNQTATIVKQSAFIIVLPNTTWKMQHKQSVLGYVGKLEIFVSTLPVICAYLVPKSSPLVTLRQLSSASALIYLPAQETFLLKTKWVDKPSS